MFCIHIGQPDMACNSKLIKLSHYSMWDTKDVLLLSRHWLDLRYFCLQNKCSLFFKDGWHRRSAVGTQEVDPLFWGCYGDRISSGSQRVRPGFGWRSGNSMALFNVQLFIYCIHYTCSIHYQIWMWHLAKVCPSEFSHFYCYIAFLFVYFLSWCQTWI